MTTKEIDIKRAMFSSNQMNLTTDWLCEIAYQLAVRNEAAALARLPIPRSCDFCGIRPEEHYIDAGYESTKAKMIYLATGVAICELCTLGKLSLPNPK